jgi:hypothetical protein
MGVGPLSVRYLADTREPAAQRAAGDHTARDPTTNGAETVPGSDLSHRHRGRRCPRAPPEPVPSYGVTDPQLAGHDLDSDRHTPEGVDHDCRATQAASLTCGPAVSCPGVVAVHRLAHRTPPHRPNSDIPSSQRPAAPRWAPCNGRDWLAVTVTTAGTHGTRRRRRDVGTEEESYDAMRSGCAEAQ